MACEGTVHWATTSREENERITAFNSHKKFERPEQFQNKNLCDFLYCSTSYTDLVTRRSLSSCTGYELSVEIRLVSYACIFSFLFNYEQSVIRKTIQFLPAINPDSFKPSLT